MAKMTKTQVKNALSQIKAKAFKLLGSRSDLMSVADYATIVKICEKAQRKLK